MEKEKLEFEVKVLFPNSLKNYLDKKKIKVAKYIRNLVYKDILDKRSVLKRKNAGEEILKVDNFQKISINKTEFVNNLKNNLSLFFNCPQERLFCNEKKGGADSTTAKIILSKILYEDKHHNFKFVLKYIAKTIGRSHCTVLYYRDNYFNNKFAIEFHETFKEFEKIFFKA
jgi:hypothetical protein